MTTRLTGIFRKVAAAVAAGTLLQANGCGVDINAIANGLFTSVANSLINDFVFGAFGVGGP